MTKRTKNNQGIKIIKKANTLIEARYRFDVWETRMFLSMLAGITMEDEDFQPYRIWFKDIVKVFGLKSHQSYDLLRDATKSLMQKTFNVNYTDEGYVREKAYHIIRTTDYLKEGQTGKDIEAQEYIDITIDPEMKPLLLQLKNNFTAYDLRNVCKLGAHSVRLYELLKQFESVGERRIEIDHIKRILELDSEYQNVFDFYRYFITPSLKEINDNTDIIIYDHEKIKEGRRVVGLHFYFRKKSDEEMAILRGNDPAKPRKTKQARLFDDTPQYGMETIETESKTVASEVIEHPMSEADILFKDYYQKVVESLGVTPSIFIDLLKKYNADQISQAIRITNRAKMNGQIKSNVSGFFVKALKEGFTDQKEELERKKAAETQTKKAQAHEKKVFAANQAAEEELKKQAYRKAVNDIIRNTATDAEKENVLEILRGEHSFFANKDLNDFRDSKELADFFVKKFVEIYSERFALLHHF